MCVSMDRAVGACPRDLHKFCVACSCCGTHTPISPRGAQIAFTFSSGFLLDAVRFRMQSVHRDTLQKFIQLWNDKHQSELKKIYLKKMLDDSVWSACPHSIAAPSLCFFIVFLLCWPSMPASQLLRALSPSPYFLRVSVRPVSLALPHAPGPFLPPSVLL